MDLNSFFSDLGHDVPLPTSRCYVSMPVLTFLTGLPWNQLAMNWVQALNPTRLRVTTGAMTLEGNQGRVTVCVFKRKDGVHIINGISQEVSPEAVDVAHGEDLLRQTAEAMIAAKRNPHHADYGIYNVI